MSNSRNPISFFAAAAVIVLAIMLYDMMGGIVKYLSERYSTAQLAMLRNVFGLLPTALILVFSRNWIDAGRPIVIRQWRLALARGGLGTVAQISLYLAIFHLEFATATAIVFAGPLFVTALSIPVLGHRVGFRRWCAVLVGFVGVMMVMEPNPQSMNWYAVLPLVAAFGFASTSVTAQLFDPEVPTPLINLYFTFGSLVGTGLLAFFTNGFSMIAYWQDWLLIVLMGVAGGLAAYCMITAYRMAKPSSLAPFEYFAIPSSFVIGWVFFGEAPFDRLLPGVILIVGSGLFMMWREHVLKGATKIKK